MARTMKALYGVVEESKRLRMAETIIDRWAQHDRDCDRMRLALCRQDGPAPCTCGLDEAIRELRDGERAS